MKKLIIKMLGLESLVTEIDLLKNEVHILTDEVAELSKFKKDLAMAQEGLSAKVDEVSEKVDGMEEFDADDFVREDDVNDRIESYLNDNDYITSSYCDDEIQSKVDDAVESAVEDLDIEEKVRDLFNDASPAPMSEQEIKDEITRTLRAMFLDGVAVEIKLK